VNASFANLPPSKILKTTFTSALVLQSPCRATRPLSVLHAFILWPYRGRGVLVRSLLAGASPDGSAPHLPSAS
jgi:hypothetical protein